MAYCNLRIEVWCDWNPVESDLEETALNISAQEAICTKREVVAIVDRPQDIDEDEAMTFFGGEEGDADLTRGRCFPAASIIAEKQTEQASQRLRRVSLVKTPSS